MAERIPAEIIEILGRSGVRGINQVRCRVVEGDERGKVLVRDVLGPVRIGDTLMLKEVEMETPSSIGRRK
jgi:small subunit ribosomal protein S28e